MGPIGMPELVIVLVLVLIVFGAGKLPEGMSSMGKGVSEFRKASTGEAEEKVEPKAGSDAEPPPPGS
jgi:sec-independent protein translocase protein TatA